MGNASVPSKYLLDHTSRFYQSVHRQVEAATVAKTDQATRQYYPSKNRAAFSKAFVDKQPPYRLFAVPVLKLTQVGKLKMAQCGVAKDDE